MIKPIITGTRNLVKFVFTGGNVGNNALATIKDLQQVIQGVNNNLYYRQIDFMLTNNNQSNPTFKLLQAGASECLGSCNCTGDCGCAGTIASPGCTKEAFPIITGVAKSVAAGTYTVTFAANHPDLVNRGVAVFVSAPLDKNTVITVSKMVNRVITIVTYSSGVASNTILDGTVFSVRLYVNK